MSLDGNRVFNVLTLDAVVSAKLGDVGVMGNEVLKETGQLIALPQFLYQSVVFQQLLSCIINLMHPYSSFQQLPCQELQYQDRFLFIILSNYSEVNRDFTFTMNECRSA